VSDDRIAEALSKKADQYVQMVGHMARVAMPEVEEVRATVLLKMEQGDLNAARQILGALRKELQVRRARLCGDEAELVSEDAQIDLLQAVDEFA
jgi:hypothetical protein